MAILHAGSSEVVNVPGAAVKRVLWEATSLTGLTVLLEYIDLFSRAQPTAPPSATSPQPSNTCNKSLL